MADKVIKTTFKLDGESEYKRAVKNINSELKVLDSEMKEVNSRYDKNDKSMKKLTEQGKILSKQYEQQADKVSYLENAVKDSTEAYDKAVDKYNEAVEAFGKNSVEAEKAAKAVDKAKGSMDSFSIQLNNARTSLNNTEKSLTAVNEEIANLNNQEVKEIIPAKIIKNLKPTKEQLENVATAAKNVATFCGKAAAEAGKIGAKTLTTSLKVTTEAFTAYAAAASAAATAIFNVSAEAGLFADDINTLAKQTGLDTGTLQEYTYASSLIDVEVDTIAKLMAKLTKNMTSTSKEVQGAFSTLGVSIRDNVTGELRNNEVVFNELISALGKVENETERDNLAMQIFGKSAQDLNPLILGGAEQLTELSKSAREAGLVLSQETLDDLNSFNDSLDVLKGNLTASKRLIAVEFAGSFKTVTDRIGAAIPKISTAVAGMFNAETAEEAEKDFKRIIEGLSADIGKDIEGMLPVFLNGINSIASSVSGVLPGAVATLLPYLIDGLTQLVKDIVAAIPTLLPVLTDGAIELFTGLIGGLNAVISELTPMLPTIINNLAKTIIESLPLIVGTAYELFIGLINGLTQAMPEILQAITDLMPELSNEITKNLPLLFQSGIDLVVAIAQGLPQALPALISAMGEVITALLNEPVYYEDIENFGAAIGDTFVNTFTAALGVIDGLLGTNLQSWYEDVTEFWRDAGAKLYEITHADELEALQNNEKYSQLNNDIILKSNEYMRQGVDPVEAMNRAIDEVIDTDDKNYFFQRYLSQTFTEENAYKQYELLKESGQIGANTLSDNGTAAYYENMGKAALAEKDMELTNRAVNKSMEETGYKTSSQHYQYYTFNNNSPKSLSAQETLQLNERQKQMTKIYE